MTDLAKKKIRLSWIFIFVFYITYQIYSAFAAENASLATSAKAATSAISLAGGICGSLFGFLVSPKKRSAPRKNFDDTELEAEPDAPAKQGLFGKKHSLLKKAEKARKSSSKDETVIGTISL